MKYIVSKSLGLDLKNLRPRSRLGLEIFKNLVSFSSLVLIYNFVIIYLQRKFQINPPYHNTPKIAMVF